MASRLSKNGDQAAWLCTNGGVCNTASGGSIQRLKNTKREMTLAVATCSLIPRIMAQSNHFVRTLHLFTPRPNYPPVKPPEPMVVKLTETESKICANLDGFCKKRAQDRPEEDQIVCRIAGGWVRDKVSSNTCFFGTTCTDGRIIATRDRMQ